MVLGGDLNFTLSLREVWGSNPREDRQKGFFLSFMEAESLVDLEPVKFSPTWRNFRTGNDVVDKRLDCFLISEKLMDMGLIFKAKIEEGGSLDHRPISLFWSSKADSPPVPLKINQVWLAEEDFRKLVASHLDKAKS